MQNLNRYLINFFFHSKWSLILTWNYWNIKPLKEDFTVAVFKIQTVELPITIEYRD